MLSLTVKTPAAMESLNMEAVAASPHRHSTRPLTGWTYCSPSKRLQYKLDVIERRRRWTAAQSRLFGCEFVPVPRPRADAAPVTMSPVAENKAWNREWRRRIQIFLIVLLIAAGVRLFLIYRERHSAGTNPKSEAAARPLSADVYV